MRLQGIEVERNIGQRGRQDTAGRATGQICVKRVAVGHATAVFVNQFIQGDARRCQLDVRRPDAPAYRK